MPCQPRVCPATVLPPVVLYSDGAFEQGLGTWGSIVVDPVTKRRWVFGGRVPDCLMEKWSAGAGEQVICG